MVKLTVKILSGNGIGGQSPFVVVGLDKYLQPELYKSPAAPGGPICTWNVSFDLDLTTAMKNVMAQGHPEPMFITFNLFDAGKQGFPSLGSTGVKIEEVRNKDYESGEFHVVNGTGSLTLDVRVTEKKGWITQDTAKKAGIVGAVGVGVIAAGLTARHIHKKNKEKKEHSQDPYSSSGGPPEGYPNSSVTRR